MPTQESQSRIETGKTNWIPIHINDGQSPADLPSGFGESPQQEIPWLASSYHLFEHTQKMRAPLPERFPRLTFLAIAVALLAFALTAEFDYLRGAGYYWP
jgi:hypothetical protein